MVSKKVKRTPVYLTRVVCDWMTRLFYLDTHRAERTEKMVYFEEPYPDYKRCWSMYEIEKSFHGSKRKAIDLQTAKHKLAIKTTRENLRQLQMELKQIQKLREQI